MLMRLNLDKVTHPIHCYYPASGKKYFDRLRYGTIYHETIQVIEHPVDKAGVVDETENFRIEATFLEHGIDNLGWKVTEKDTRKFDRELLHTHGVHGPLVSQLEKQGFIEINGKRITLDEVSSIRKGESIAVVIDTRFCKQAIEIAKGVRILLAESTYLDTERDLAYAHHHLTAKEAAIIAQQAGAEQLILTHFSARYLNLKELQDEASQIFPNTQVAEDFKRFPFPKKK
ncbi:MAG: ribonuclease [Chlamydiia bacterium]|nr:ribonuclease [Chlamydiia bacterium]